jgi:hypothetical protein
VKSADPGWLGSREQLRVWVRACRLSPNDLKDRSKYAPEILGKLLSVDRGNCLAPPKFRIGRMRVANLQAAEPRSKLQ